MKMRHLLIILILLLFLSFDVHAYMLIFHKESFQVHDIIYRNIIIYDKENSKVGLIPQIAFKGKPHDFCIIVLTPSKPDISELDQEIFYEAEVLTNSVWRERGIKCGSSGDFLGMDKDYEERPESLQNIMIEETLEISNITPFLNSDSNALIKWLDTEGFLYSENDKKAIDYYSALNWSFTAIKPDFPYDENISEDQPEGNIYKIKPLLFKYNTESLVYPMRLLPETTGGYINLVIYVLSNHKMTLEEHTEYIEYANQFDNRELESIKNLYPGFTFLIGQQRYLTKLKPKLSIMMDEDNNIKDTEDNTEFRKVIYYGISPAVDLIPLGIVAIIFLAFQAFAKRKSSKSR